MMQFLKLTVSAYVLLYLCSDCVSSLNGQSHIMGLSEKNSLLGSQKQFLEPGFSKSIIPLASPCKAYLRAIAKATAELVECLMMYARPLTLCEHCKRHFYAVKELYKNVTQVTSGDLYSSCHDSLLRSDIIHVVGQSHEFVKRIWKESSCEHCFNSKTKDVAASFTHFKVLFNATSQCLSHYISNSPTPIFTTGRSYHGVGNTTYNNSACNNCHLSYSKLNKYYEKLEEQYKKAVCMDIVDAMNYTRYTWSASFKCTLVKKDIVSVLALTAFFCLLPVTFYIGTKLHGSKQQKQILKQKRFQRRGSCNYGAASSMTSGEVPANVIDPPPEQEVMFNVDDNDVQINNTIPATRNCDTIKIHSSAGVSNQV